MITKRATCQRVIVGLLLAVCCQVGSAQEMRTWTNQNGDSVVAALVDVAAGQAVLRREDGATMRVPVARFIDADRQRLNDWLTVNRGTGAVTAPTNTAELAAFADGPWKGWNTVYQGRGYDALVSADGNRIELHVKQDGARVGKPLIVALGCHYYDPAKRNTIARPLAAFTAPPAPQMLSRPGKLKLSGLFADNVRFDVTLEFTEKEFSIEGKIKDPPRLTPASAFGYHARVQPTHTLPPETPLDQVKALMPGWSVRLTPPEGKPEEVPYWRGKGLKSQHVTEARVHGPWETRDVALRAPLISRRETQTKVAGYFAIYEGMAPYTGFHVGRAAASDQKGGALVVAFD